MKYELPAKQYEASLILADDSIEEFIYGGAAGGAKSWVGCLWLVDRCTRYPGTRWVMGRAKLKTLKETTLNTFFKVAKMYGVNYEYKGGQINQIHFPNGSIILLKDLFLYPSDPEFDNLGSLEISGAFVDEVNQITYKAWTILKSRCRDQLDENGLVPKIFGACNPSKNWVYQEFYKPWKEGKLKKGRAFLQALVGDNPYISKSYVRNLQGLPKASRERLLNGNWEYDDDPNTLCTIDKITDLWTNDHAEKGEKYITADIALQGSDKLVIGVWDGWVLEKIVVQDKSESNEVVNLIKDLATTHKVGRSNITFDNDGIGAYLAGYLKGARPFRNGSRPMKKEKYKNLKCQCEFYLADKINENGILIKPKSHQEEIVEEIEQLKSYHTDKDAPLQTMPKEEVKKVLGRSPDFRDMMTMRMYFELLPKGRARVSVLR